MTQKDVFMQVAWQYYGVPYHFGGANHKGIDCSGLVVECLKSVGLMKAFDDATADQIWKKYLTAHGEKDHAEEGTLAFWFDDGGKAYHVAICIDDYYCLTADGGSSQVFGTKWEDVADALNAFIKVRPIDHRKSKPKFVHIFEED